MKPYTDKNSENFIYREFSEDTLEEELVWHKDERTREVFIQNPTDWMFQFENELPFVLETSFTIVKGTYHRVIKGTGKLVIKLLEY